MSTKGVVSEILRQKKRRAESGVKVSGKKGPLKRTSIALPEPLYKGLKTCAVIEGIKMNELMIELLREGLKSRLRDKNLEKVLKIDEL